LFSEEELRGVVVPYHIAFLTVPAYGHVRPTLGVVEELVRRGHRISYLAVDEFAPLVSEVGATTVPYHSVLTEALGTGQRDVVDANGLAWSPVMFLQESKQLVPVLKKHFADDIPDLLVYDVIVCAAGRALAEKWQRPSLQSTPTFATTDRHSHLANIFEVGGVRSNHPAKAELNRQAAEFVVEHGLRIAPADLISLAAEHSLLYLPRPFQPEADSCPPGNLFVGPCLTSADFATTWMPPRTEDPVLLVSMGTLFNDQPDVFRTCVGAFAGRPWRVVVTLGNNFDPALLGPLPDNVEVHQWVPQLTALSAARVFVNHGGFGSLLASVHAGVPQVMIPRIPESVVWARRTEELGLGRTILPAGLTERSLADVVLGLHADPEVYRRAEWMQAQSETAGGAGRAASAIEDLAGTTR
jgi:MGT family glycosyltransferase